jgi:hypothetical protein
MAVEEWQNIRWENESWSEDGSGLNDLIQFLAGCGKPEAVRALAAGFHRASRSAKNLIVMCFNGPKPDPHASGERESSIDDLLVAALMDGEVVSMSGAGPSGREVRDPSIGDLAADVLAQRWGNLQLFDPSARLWVRERQRFDLKNAWLKKAGRPMSPVPQRRKVGPAPVDKVQPLLDALREAKTAEERRTAACRLDAMGLPALHAAREALRTTKPEHPRYSELYALVRRLSLIVGEVRFTEDSVTPSEAFRKLVEGYQGKAVTRENFVGLLVSAMEHLSPGTQGFRLSVERPGDDSGVTLRASLVASRPIPKGVLPSIATDQEIVVGPKPVFGILGSAASGAGPMRSQADSLWRDLSVFLETALQSKPEEYLLVRISCEDGGRK